MAETKKAFYTYILICADHTYYTGITTDIEKRIRQHNGELTGGAKYTRARRPVTLHYLEEHDSRTEATKREIQIKKLSKQQKQSLVEAKH